MGPLVTLPAGAARTVLTADGAVLAVTDTGAPGDGAPVAVLAHCWTGGRAVWTPVVSRLVADGWRAVLYDQRGHGASSVGRDGCTIEVLGRDLGEVLVQLDLRDVALAGHSMGGMTIQSYVAQFSPVAVTRVRRVVLVATATAGLGRGERRDDLLARIVRSPAVERVMRARHGHWLVRAVFGRGARRADVVLTRDLFVACPRGVRGEFLRAMTAMDLRSSLRDAPMPVCIVAGARDRLTPPRRHVRTMTTAWPAATVTTLRGAGHMLPLEAPDAVTAAIAGD